MVEVYCHCHRGSVQHLSQTYLSNLSTVIFFFLLMILPMKPHIFILVYNYCHTTCLNEDLSIYAIVHVIISLLKNHHILAQPQLRDSCQGLQCISVHIHTQGFSSVVFCIVPILLFPTPCFSQKALTYNT